MTITCPSCGFAGGFAATMPSQAQRVAGAASRPVDLLDNPAFLEPAVGEIALCSSCGAALVFAGWIEMDDAMLQRLGPSDQHMIRQGREAIRRHKGNNKPQ